MKFASESGGGGGAFNLFWGWGGLTVGILRYSLFNLHNVWLWFSLSRYLEKTKVVEAGRGMNVTWRKASAIFVGRMQRC